ncbi:hypothetical protein RY27_13345, partial [Litorilinea aerophila]
IYATTVTDRRGNFAMRFTMPAQWPDGTPIEPGRLVVIVATSDLSLGASASFTYRAPTPTVAPNPYASLSPSSGGPGTVVTVSGGGFPANTRVNAHLAGLVGASALAETQPHVYATARTDGNGNFQLSFAMPSQWPDGSPIESGKLVELVATADFSARASADFDYFVVAPNPSINLAPASGGAGTTVTVSGDGFPANTTVSVYLGTLDSQIGRGSNAQRYAVSTTDRQGRYSMSFTMPSH